MRNWVLAIAFFSTIVLIGAGTKYFVTQSVTMPQILNNVESSASGGVRVTSAYITNSGTPAVDRQDGTWIDSLTDNATGNTTINVTSGTFSEDPNCVCTAFDSNDFCGLLSQSQSAVNVYTRKYDGTSEDVNLSVICVGAK